MQLNNLVICTGSNSSIIATKIGDEFGLDVALLQLGRHDDGELILNNRVDFNGKTALIVHSLGPNVSENYFNLMLMAANARNLGAAKIVVFSPYLGFARENCSLIYALKYIKKAGVDRLITVDAHCPKVLPAFVTNLSPAHEIAKRLQAKPKNLVITAPDDGAEHRAREVSLISGHPYVVMSKLRDGPKVKCRIDVNLNGQQILLVDDILSTGKTAQAAVNELKSKGAGKITCCITHMLNTDIDTFLKKNPDVSVCFSDSLESQIKPGFSCANIFIDFLNSSDAQRIFR